MSIVFNYRVHHRTSVDGRLPEYTCWVCYNNIVKLVFSEYPAKYEGYVFPYKVWAIEESKDERSVLLNQGFLPSRMKIGLWYLARSLRIDLQTFTESSENRRVVKNTHVFSCEVQEKSAFSLTEEKLHWVSTFAKEVAKKAEYSASSVKRIFSSHASARVMVWLSEGVEVGYSPLMETDRAIFYWHGFHKSDITNSGLGARMMLEAVKWAKEHGKQYAYLGTVYTNASLYKTNYKGWQFFNGFRWSNSKEELKFLIGKDQYDDGNELLMDEKYRERFYNNDIVRMLKG
jgi:hypothetical protein